MSKRSRVSDEDRDLFRRAAGEVRRIEDDRVPPSRSGRVARSRPRARTDASNLPSGSPELTESEWSPDVGPGDVLSFVRGGVQRREFERLRKGRFTLEGDLDLHGRIVADAVVALDGFLDESRRRGHRCVRIVHGKGFGSRSGRPIMKAYVDRWLRARSEVLAFCSATPPDGGTGALYVLIRR